MINYLIVVLANLAGMLVIYSFLAFFLARRHWHGSKISAVLATIIMAQLFWIFPATLGLRYAIVAAPAIHALWFGNWVVSAFAVILLLQAVKKIPRQLEEAARLDGCHAPGTYWHVVLPLVRRELGLIAFLTVLATALPLWTITIGFSALARPESVASMLALSAIAILPILAILFVTSRAPLRSRY